MAVRAQACVSVSEVVGIAVKSSGCGSEETVGVVLRAQACVSVSEVMSEVVGVAVGVAVEKTLGHTYCNSALTHM